MSSNDKQIVKFALGLLSIYIRENESIGWNDFLEAAQFSGLDKSWPVGDFTEANITKIARELDNG